jgi:predicted Holliday junction resolvase-like endonuclease
VAIDLVAALSEFDSILVVCPCCGEVVRLSETRPYAKGKKPRSVFDALDADEARLERAEERLEEREDELREAAREIGRRAAKRQLKRIDPVFSGAGIDPQDVKVVFDPVEYVVFDGLNRGRLKRIALMAYPPSNRAQEKAQDSVAAAARKGNVEFATLRIGEDGSVGVE